MSKSSTMALAVGAGYMLGRRRKLRMAVLLVGAAATGSAGGLAGRALSSGGKLLTSPQVLDKLPPEAAKLADLVRSDLVQAGKSAAQAALSSRINGWTSALNDQAEAVRAGGGSAGSAGDKRREDEDHAADQERGRAHSRPERRRRPEPERRDGRRRGPDRQTSKHSGPARKSGR